MIAACIPTARFRRLAAALLAVVGLCGCHSIDFYDTSLEGPVALEMEPPRELSMASLPAYRIEPPDVLQLEMLKQVPLPPYRAEAYDVLQIQVVGTFMDAPIYDYYMVEAEGTVNLGPSYGTVRVIGMTIAEIRESITRHLSQILARPEVSVQLARSAGSQPIAGEYLVGPDGTVNLRQYGLVSVAGKTVAEAKAAIEKHLAQYFDSPEVSLTVLAYNSKVFYIITEGAGLGDNFVRVPITGNETVLDALSNVGGLSQLSSTNVYIARPAPGGFGCEQILPVDYIAITRGGSPATNYQMMPDDRLFIAQNETIALTNFIGRLTGPAERLLGITSLSASTIRSLQTTGRNYNRNRY
ncbi:MAG: polysaccharide biosynthesis/export family protein [Pirellulales bacterium]|nr:polysaccharide biosynthesis/export family protein [Pirellulales bacterium]